MKNRTLAALALAAPLAFAGLSSAQDEAVGGTGDLPALFTAEQAEQGQRTYAVSCGGCHGTDMPGIFAGYNTAEAYYLFISGSMPADNPGSLSPQQYADIIAYMMREVGFPAGDEPLTADREILAQIVPGDALD